MPFIVRIIAVVGLGVAFWTGASLSLDVAEPWDSPHYLWAWLAALGLSAMTGRVFGKPSWLWGALIVSGQLPVMAVQSGVGPLMAAGLVMLFFLALPASLVSMAASRIRTVRRRGSGR